MYLFGYESVIFELDGKCLTWHFPVYKNRAKENDGLARKFGKWASICMSVEKNHHLCTQVATNSSVLRVVHETHASALVPVGV